MSYGDDSNRTDPEQTPNPRPDPAESAGPTGWLDALNSFLERAVLKADGDTGWLPPCTGGGLRGTGFDSPYPLTRTLDAGTPSLRSWSRPASARRSLSF